jgi:hypothetical protein
MTKLDAEEPQVALAVDNFFFPAGMLILPGAVHRLACSATSNRALLTK